jgi:hypothetical protein
MADEETLRRWEELGSSWRNLTDAQLAGTGTTDLERAGLPVFQPAGTIEMIRRQMEATKELTFVTRELVKAVRASSDATVQQNTHALQLTYSMRFLAIIAIGLTLVQIVVAMMSRQP